MKSLKTLGFLGNGNAAKTAPEEDGRVVELFRSRAELPLGWNIVGTWSIPGSPGTQTTN